jgi:hypothetical protein
MPNKHFFFLARDTYRLFTTRNRIFAVRLPIQKKNGKAYLRVTLGTNSVTKGTLVSVFCQKLGKDISRVYWGNTWRKNTDLTDGTTWQTCLPRVPVFIRTSNLQDIFECLLYLKKK